MERELGARHRGLGAQDAIENYNLKKTCVKREHVDLERIDDGNPNGLQCLLQEKIKKKKKEICEEKQEKRAVSSDVKQYA